MDEKEKKSLIDELLDSLLSGETYSPWHLDNLMGKVAHVQGYVIFVRRWYDAIGYEDGELEIRVFPDTELASWWKENKEFVGEDWPLELALFTQPEYGGPEQATYI